jgi:cytochrome c oxidase subunit 2
MTPRLIGLVLLGLLASGCKDTTFSRMGFPEPITKQGHNLLGVWRGSLVTAAFVGAFVIALILYSSIFYRRKGDELPRQVRYNLPIEVLYTVIPMIMVAVLFYFTAIRENDQDKFSSQPADMSINVVGFQWNWQFNYLDQGVSVTGTPGNIPTLVLPAGETVRFYETSPDVVHAFWVIPFLFKRDVLPGRINSFQETLDANAIGHYQGKCTEFCGTYHDRMLFKIDVVSKADYQAWLARTKSVAAAGSNPMFSVYNGPGSAAFKAAGTGETGDTQRSHE